MRLDAVWYWRQTDDDGVFNNGGILVRGDGGSDARFLGTQFDITVTFEVHRTFDVTAGWSVFEPGGFLEATGASETVHFATVEMRFRF